MTAAPPWLEDLGSLLGGDKVITDPERLAAFARDYYWYSPILRHQLDGKTAEAVVRIENQDELARVISFCAIRRIPLTLRGAGTGNYGQSTPLQQGVQADVTGMNRILSLENGRVRAETGARLGSIEEEARRGGWEMRCLPSTWVKSTLGGFIAGGSGGIGSITYGLLRDSDNLCSMRLLTMEEEPRLLNLEGTEALDAHYSFGTNGIIVDATLSLGSKRNWDQWAFSSADFDRLFDFGLELASDSSVAKRLVSIHEWPIPSFFRPIASRFPPGEHTLFMEVAAEHGDRLRERASAAGLRVGIFIPAHEPRRSPMLSDYCINHTTLWALKTDPSLTYLAGQDFDRLGVREQYRSLKRSLPDELWLHFEILKRGGTMTVRGLPLVKFTTLERFQEIISICEQLGVPGGSPHTYFLDEKPIPGGFARIYGLKGRADPFGLLNPGKLKHYAAPSVALKER